MPNFPSLHDKAHLSDVFRRFPKGVRPLLELHDAILRRDSEIPKADRELIAAWVSGLNQCAFCFGAHKLMAQAFGVDRDLFDGLFLDFEKAPLPAKMVSLLRFAKKLTLEPERITQYDVDLLLLAGWSEDAVYDATQVIALYAYMNRLVQVTGITPGAEYAQPDAEALEQRRNGGYLDWGRREGFTDCD